ncbi:SPOR domain-containing protein [Marinobacter nanhaiticus D15-8W]|uniref:Sporulation protein n=1 Tax=Marinobacter nanhaiticus D15-8W TaxID=626887 RepID=N6VVM8_9GAMM|nr:SPOR domain-containing protein [Marinobacter nanhaiticus]ENO14215.1 sporulation protein [Marinobacter nanhaiticus D15-8W]BES71602.1 SPOR domain-containing protein [Marinobacter nanhaiticus D15-8W]
MDGLKQRIVGALVLISLAVIFVPMLFDEPHTERTSKTIELPEEPAFPSVDVNESADQPAPLEQSPAFTLEESPAANQPTATDAMSEPVAVEAPAPESTSAPESASAPEQQPVAVSEPRPEPPPAPAKTTQPTQSANPGTSAKTEEGVEYSRALEGAWLVQLGSFGNADNATRLRDKVREKGYAAYTQSVERGDMTLTRVFSGPFVSEQEAKSAKSRLDKSFSLNSLVMEGDS